MKTLKKLFVALAVLVIIAAVLPSSAFAASDDYMYFGRNYILNTKSNKAALLWAYDKIVSGIDAANNSIDISHANYKIDSSELGLIMDMILYDHPEFFWLDFDAPHLYSWAHTGNTVLKVMPAYSMTGSSLAAAKTKFNNKISALLSGLSGKSDYEKSLILHDRVAETVTYAFEGKHQTAYGALVDGAAVCAGYARAYQVLLQKAEIPAWYIVGTSVNPDTKNPENHAWNMVRLDGAWYYSDVTWDDQDNTLFHAYFNLTTEYINEGHAADNSIKSYLPNATTTDNNYFVKNNAVYTAFDYNRIKNAFIDNKTISIFLSGNTTSFFEELNAALGSIATEASSVPISSCKINIKNIGREYQIALYVTEINHKHSLSYVPKKSPTCLSTGYVEYYTCSCGKRFSDSNAKNEITDTDSLKLAALAHTPSGWKSNSSVHWKECTSSYCGSVIANTEAKHSDSDGNGKCDICSYTLDSPPPVPSNQSSSTVSSVAEGNTEDNISNATVSDASPTDDAEKISNTDSELAASEPFSLFGLSGGMLITVTSAAVVLGGGTATAVILIKKKP